MLVGKLRILIHQANGHNEVLGNSFCVLLGESLQFVAGNLVELISGYIVINPGVIVVRANHT